ncbi:hypothetical protein [Desulfothermobacter acidiphilus]|uniref:prenylated flavin chaperone LpdD n=1 Tax=Desulfothermobacter acidiphilus TaxID=1938353 RepID=UPI003F8A0792
MALLDFPEGIELLTVTTGEGPWRLLLFATRTKEGVIVQLLGGDKPHVGAIVISLPRPSRSVPGKISTTTTVLPLYGHQDDEVARPVAEALARHLDQPVVVVAGVHIERATPADIEKVKENSSEALRLLLQQLL